MGYALETRSLSKRFGSTTALDQVTVAIPRHSIVGLVGKNGTGKTTLLRHHLGLYLPTEGEALTLGTPAAALSHEQLVRIGVVHQESRFLDWMSVEQQIRYVASFYPNWDREREARLRDDLEIDPYPLVGVLSPGNVQKLALVLAVCHHPELLLLDEPISSLDPIARNKLLAFLVGLLEQDETTIVISSHALRDLEQIVDWVVCLSDGRATTNAALDDLKEAYAEWRLTSRGGPLPEHFDEAFVLAQRVSGRQASLLVRQEPGALDALRSRYEVEAESRPLNLEQMFPLLAQEELE